MKRVLGIWGLGLVILVVSCGLWTANCLAVDPYRGEWGEFGSHWSYFGEISDPTDTLWIPGLGLNDSIPNIRGINLTQYRYLGFEVAIIQSDTTLTDSLLVDLWTGYYGHVDSVIAAVAVGDITDGVLYDTCTDFPDCPKAIKWVVLADTTEDPAFWFQKYAWLRLWTHVNSDNETDTTFTGATDGDTWSAAGDSLADWNTQNADGMFWTVLNEASWDSFVYVQGKDSLFAISLNEMSAAQSPGTIDSVTFAVAYWESLATVAEDTLRLGIAFGDTSQHHYDSLDIGVKGSGVLWATQQALDSTGTAELRDTVYFTFTTDPHGNAWTRTTLDSCLVVFDPVHVDTVTGDNGTLGILCVYRFWSTTYHSRTELFPSLRYRATIWLKK